ncbi:DUF2934 domain-containing protein [Lichenihabitans sp. Uapishka_5]|uniref:DUF2934 domain-containing protein n=1 Tax=Lichenihabitans sp. Uapishka_5 TaxID=3037302 RepID=UPI0029E803C2|nr:DUF2934 domain-containing protein [Lichenihabitans sp. Uapishka_5]MDX7949834.1 DUF2934 domain-containing protein [Lichenihabitans sp. Uapishka_5]
MSQDPDHDRIATKAHELWEAAGRPHGRDQDHWEQARELVAIHDSLGDTLLPRDTGAEEPIEEPDAAIRNMGDMPNLTDQGENLLTSTDREPDFVATPSARDGEMPSVEVPTSDQPGIPGKARRGKVAEQGAKAGEQPAPDGDKSAPQAKTNMTPKKAKSESSKGDAPRKGGRSKA